MTTQQELVEKYSLLRAHARATNEIKSLVNKHAPGCKEVDNIIERFFQGDVNAHGDIYTTPIYVHSKLITKMRSEFIDGNKHNRKVKPDMIDRAIGHIIDVYNGIVAMESPPMITLGQINKAMTISRKNDDAVVSVVSFDDFSINIESRYAKIFLKYVDSDVKMMLMKYIALAVGHQQWSIPTSVYEKIIEMYPSSTIVEGFASPMNSKLLLLGRPKFCSASFETDEPFGSIGSFFETSLVWPDGIKTERADVVWVINPPFVETVLDATANRCVDAIEYAKENGHKLTIIGITPNWTDMLGYQRIRSSANYFSVLERNKHFFEGINASSERIVARFRSAFYVLSTESNDYGKIVLPMRKP